MRPFVTARIGYPFWKSKASTYINSLEDSGNALSYAIGAGVKYTINSTFFALANVDYNVINSEGNINYTAIRAGLGYTIP